MTDNTSSNRQIAKNTVMLYIRMLLFIAISLYTSRVVLNTLGVEDYGIYGVVGGVVAMFGFLNTSMSGATSRFLTYEMGRGDFQRLKETFCTALIIHIAIAVILFILAETIGLWFLIYKLVIPEERMFAAHVVYQLSIFSTMISITQVPYNAAIIAHEKMDIYAYVELLNGFLKLLIVFLLPILGNDKLIVYACLVLVVSIFIASIYRIYCLRYFKESEFHYIYKKEMIYPMLSFSGLDLYGNMSLSWRQQGINFLINIFFGPALNASSSIATTIQGVIAGLSRSVTMAYRPQIIKNYAMANYQEVNKLLIMAVKFTLALFIMVAIPVFIEIEIVLKMWLGFVPEYSTDFFRLIIISYIFDIVSGVLIIPIHASGKIKQLSFWTGSLYLFSLLPMYIALKMKYPPQSVYLVMILFSIVILTVYFLVLKKNTVNIKIFPVIKELCTSILSILLVSSVVYYISSLLHPDFIRLLIITLTSIILYGFCFLFFQINREQRLILYKKIFKC